jgi:hypothetical protein
VCSSDLPTRTPGAAAGIVMTDNVVFIAEYRAQRRPLDEALAVVGAA